MWCIVVHRVASCAVCVRTHSPCSTDACITYAAGGGDEGRNGFRGVSSLELYTRTCPPPPRSPRTRPLRGDVYVCEYVSICRWGFPVGAGFVLPAAAFFFLLLLLLLSSPLPFLSSLRTQVFSFFPLLSSLHFSTRCMYGCALRSISARTYVCRYIRSPCSYITI